VNGCLEVSQRLGRVVVLGGGKVGKLRGDIMELLPDGLVFLGDGGESLG